MGAIRKGNWMHMEFVIYEKIIIKFRGNQDRFERRNSQKLMFPRKSGHVIYDTAILSKMAGGEYPIPECNRL